jgi:hypothetical protein
MVPSEIKRLQSTETGLSCFSTVSRGVLKPRLTVVIAILCLVLSWRDARAATQPAVEVPTYRQASSFLPAGMLTGSHHRVHETVVCDGYMHHFTVDSAFGVFHVTGDGALRKLVREIRAIAVLSKVAMGAAYIEGVIRYGRQPLEFGFSLITDPLDTVAGVPKGLGQLFQDIATSFSSATNPSEDGLVAQLLAMSSAKRLIGRDLDVDVYSRNAVLQNELNRLAWCVALGNLSVSIALIPVGGTVVQVVSLTNAGQELNCFMADQPPARLRQRNQIKLESAGVPMDLITRFLNHPHYTPRHYTVIATSLGAMDGTRGSASLIYAALQAHDEVSANFVMHVTEMLKGYHQKVAPIQQIMIESPLVFARAANGAVVIPLPVDYGMWTERASQLVPALLERYQKRNYNPAGVNKFEMWVTGTLTPTAKQQLAELGADVVENVHTRIEFVD